MTDAAQELAARLRAGAVHDVNSTDWWVNYCSEIHEAAELIGSQAARIAELEGALGSSLHTMIESREDLIVHSARTSELVGTIEGIAAAIRIKEPESEGP